MSDVRGQNELKGESMDAGFFGLGLVEIIVLAGCCGFVPLAAIVGGIVWYATSKDSDGDSHNQD